MSPTSKTYNEMFMNSTRLTMSAAVVADLNKCAAVVADLSKFAAVVVA
jgi:hypothetical protein